jgi:hypothetical protein
VVAAEEAGDQQVAADGQAGRQRVDDAHRIVTVGQVVEDTGQQDRVRLGGVEQLAGVR